MVEVEVDHIHGETSLHFSNNDLTIKLVKDLGSWSGRGLSPGSPAKNFSTLSTELKKS